ncbi:TPA: hypothetical protein CPT87_07220 [Candidatus Gastranaerophilales bacterium HUM_5]|nr:MAG TPA: hypothetical protein CPT99_09845 [Candidatus Gastranaerophilales bacterium HUM_4]DAA90999.1 MAG TPA: hypothetical protein CPT87_07220 [Candidatus Gastranaerophilales bacterium HUM_5]
MKKIVLTLLAVLISANITHATGLDPSANIDHGLIYSGSKFPQSVGKSTNITPPKNLSELRCGISTASNILGLVETGDASIEAAAKNGGITNIHYVDTKIGKVYIPLLFIPVYVKETKTLVYGD